MPNLFPTYSLDPQRIKTPLEVKIDDLLQGKDLFALNFEQQITCCRLRKELIDEVWAFIALAMEAKDYVSVVKASAYESTLGTTDPNPTRSLGSLNIESSALFPAKDPISYFYRGFYIHSMLLGIIGNENKYLEAFECLRESANTGFAPAQFLLGKAYQLGWGVSPDLTTAVYCYRLAAAQNHTGAMHELGRIYTSDDPPENCEFILPNIDDPKKWFMLSASQGYRASFLNLCTYQIKTEDVHLARLGAEQGSYVSQFTLAEFYDKDEGVEADKNLAIYWYYRAALEHFSVDLITYHIKKIGTPLARYTVALLKQQYSAMLTEAMDSSELENEFFEKELALVLGSRNRHSKTDFLNCLKNHSPNLNLRQNSFLIRFLLALDRKLVHQDPEIAEVIFPIINKLRIKDTPVEYIKPLIFFFCDLYLAGKEPCLIPLLIILWHLQLMQPSHRLDNHLNERIAKVLVGHYLNQEYSLTQAIDISDFRLLAITQYFYSTDKPTAQELVEHVGDNLLLISTANLERLLPRLLSCLSDMDQEQEGLSLYLKEILTKLQSRLQAEHPLDFQTAENIFMELGEDAESCLNTAKRISFFKLNEKEATLAKLLKKNDGLSLSDWIEKHGLCHTAPEMNMG